MSMSAATTGGMTGGASRQGRDKDTYEPELQGVRNLAARDGYDPGDGFQRPNPQLWSNASSASQSTYLPNGSGPYNRAARRRSSTGAFNDYYDEQRRPSDGYGQGQYGREYTTPRRRNRSAPRGREYLPDDYSDSESDFDDNYDDERDRALAKRRSSRGRASSRGRSQSGIRQRLQDMFSSDESEMGKGNSEAKKWAATVAGAVAGGFAARTAKKDVHNWVPTALGAFIGGITAREAEKAFYLHKDTKGKEQEAWEGRNGRD